MHHAQRERYVLCHDGASLTPLFSCWAEPDLPGWKSRICALDLEEFVAALGKIGFCPYFVAAPIQRVENIPRQDDPPRSVAL